MLRKCLLDCRVTLEEKINRGLKEVAGEEQESNFHHALW